MERTAAQNRQVATAQPIPTSVEELELQTRSACFVESKRTTMAEWEDFGGVGEGYGA